jgi:hypothetical protein
MSSIKRSPERSVKYTNTCPSAKASWSGVKKVLTQNVIKRQSGFSGMKLGQRRFRIIQCFCYLPDMFETEQVSASLNLNKFSCYLSISIQSTSFRCKFADLSHSIFSKDVLPLEIETNHRWPCCSYLLGWVTTINE